MQSTKSIITRLLSNLGTSREVEQYLKHYSNVSADRFAVIKVGGAVIRDDLNHLASALSFLRQVGLFPIVIHGAGEQLDAALSEANVNSSKVDGLRVTTPEVLDVARRVFQSVSLQLVDALEALGTRARPIATGVFEATFTNRDALGFVGDVKAVDLAPIEASIRTGHLPIIACLGETPGGQILNINADIAARELAIAVQPHKVIFLTPTGGLLDQRQHIITAINLCEDYEHLMTQPWVHSGMRVKLEQIKGLLAALPPTSSVSITSPDHLARELFTHQGSGTLIRLGERVQRYESFDELDRGRLRALVEECFRRPLVDDYFETHDIDRIYLADSYRATAIVTRESIVGGEPMPYLDKFAVTTEAQGLGLGGSIWSRMRDEVPTMFWRSRSGNPINLWYFQQAQGTYRTDEWVVFWYGMSSYETIRACVEHALALPHTLGALRETADASAS